MSNFVRNSLLGVGFIIFSFSAVIFYAARQMPVMTAESKKSIDAYFGQIKAKNYEGARQILAPNIQSEMSVAKLGGVWQKFEANNGTFEKWVPADASSHNGGRVCLFPPYVDYLLRAYGNKGAQVLFMRLAPQDGGWKISQMREVRQDEQPSH